MARKTVLKVVQHDDRAAIGHWLAGNGQALLPMLELVENALIWRGFSVPRRRADLRCDLAPARRTKAMSQGERNRQ
jgi:hypothetical protein